MAADTEPIEILLHLPLLAEDKVSLLAAARWCGGASGRPRMPAVATRTTILGP